MIMGGLVTEGIRDMRYLMPLLTALCLVGLVPAGARGQGPTWGLKGGFNVSTLRVDDPANPDLALDDQTGFLAGAFMQCSGGDWFSLQAEAIYSRNGAKVQGADLVTQISIDYLRVPVYVMARFSFRDSPLYPVVFAGPQLAFEARCKVTTEEGGVSESFDCDSEQLDDPLDTNNVEFGFVFGGGFEYLLNRWILQLDARYNLGLTNVNGGSDASVVSVENRGWSFTFGLGLSFGRP
jgi:hypothetical protein